MFVVNNCFNAYIDFFIDNCGIRSNVLQTSVLSVYIKVPDKVQINIRIMKTFINTFKIVKSIDL